MRANSCFYRMNCFYVLCLILQNVQERVKNKNKNLFENDRRGLKYNQENGGICCQKRISILRKLIFIRSHDQTSDFEEFGKSLSEIS